MKPRRDNQVANERLLAIGQRIDAALSPILDRDGIGKVDFARRIGVEYQTLRSWLIGANEPKGLNLINLARHLGVSAQWLIGASTDPRAGVEVPPPAPFLQWLKTPTGQLASSDLKRELAKLQLPGASVSFYENVAKAWASNVPAPEAERVTPDFRKRRRAGQRSSSGVLVAPPTENEDD